MRSNKWSTWYDAQPEHVKRWMKAQPIWHDNDMWKAGIVGFVCGILFGLLF